MSLRAKFKKLIFSNQLKSKLLRSHFVTVSIGVLMMIFAAGVFFWLRSDIHKLFRENIPITLTVEKLNTDLQRTVADLRGWVSLGDEKFRKDRRRVWKEGIFVKLKLLNVLSRQYSDVEIQGDLKKLESVLETLYLWQWRIEDVARTPGNYPTRVFMQNYIAPIAINIISLTSTLIHGNQLLRQKQIRPQLLVSLANFRVKFLLSVGYLKSYVLNSHQLELENSKIALAEAKIELNNLANKRRFLNSQGLELYHELMANFSSYLQLSQKLINFHQKRTNNVALDWLVKKGVPLSMRAELILQRLVLREEAQQQVTIDRIDAVSAVMPYLLFTLIVLMLLLSYWFANIQAKRMMKPILYLLSATQQMAEGELCHDIPIQSDDELGELTDNFNQMCQLRQNAEQKVKEAMIKLDKMARVDALTGLPNRYEFNETLLRVYALSKRYHRQFALLLLDLDGFKAINDIHGHDIGDALLVLVASRLKENVRSFDLVARFGGDELAIILAEVKQKSDSNNFAIKICELLRQPYRIDQLTVGVSASIGIACYPDDASETEVLLKKADIALYRAKESGGDAFCYFE